MSTKAIILAAGLGLRLRPHTEETPKCLIEVGDKSILSRQIKSLTLAGINDISIVLGFKKDAVISHAIGNFPKCKFRFVYNELFDSTNTLYSLSLAAENLGPADCVIQLNGDIVFKTELPSKMIDSFSDKSLSVVQRSRCGAEEVKFTIDQQGYISEMNKMLEPYKSCGEAVGINLFNGKMWDIFKNSLIENKIVYKDKYFEYALEKAIAKELRIYPFEIGIDEAIEIDFLEDLKRAEAMTWLCD